MMFRIWILVLLSTAVTAKWDLAVGVSHFVELLSADTSAQQQPVEQIPLLQVQIYALGYDSIRNQLYFSDLHSHGYSIFRMDLTGHDKWRPRPVVKKQDGVRGIAIDPITSTLYWTSSNSIKSLNVSGEMEEPQDGTVLFNFDKQLPHGIAVDVCNRFLYWTNKYDTGPTIERSQLDGKNRKVLIKNVDRPIGIFVDHSTQRIFWSDEQASGASHRIESADFNGDNRVIHAELDHLPLSVVVVQRRIFWLDSSTSAKALMNLTITLDKNKSYSVAKPQVVKQFDKVPYGIITAQQDSNLSSEECTVIAEKKKQIEEERKKKANAHPLEHVDNSAVLAKYNFCLNYGTVTDKGECLCPLGYGGARCETSLCHNYCVEGECRIMGGAPRCQCPSRRTGLRCQTDRCDGHCLNGGRCSVDSDDELRCDCADQFAGSRCQKKLPNVASNKLCIVYCHMQELSEEYQELILDMDHFSHLITKQPELCSCPVRTSEKGALENCTSNSLVLEERNANRVCATEGNNAAGAGGMNNAVYMLSALCLILLIVVAFLASKVWSLRKRPRIKKRIIVNKSVTPLTCRPQTGQSEQCEITIENCCNMNICETPCFEPEFRKPSAKENNSSKKEEKRNLLGGIELPPDDLY